MTYSSEFLACVADADEPCPETCSCDPAACDDDTNDDACANCNVCVDGCPESVCAFERIPVPLFYTAHRPDVQLAAAHAVYPPTEGAPA